MVKRKEVVKLFKDIGFELKGGTNHDKLVHPDGRWAVVSRHAEIGNRLFEEMKKGGGAEIAPHHPRWKG